MKYNIMIGFVLFVCLSVLLPTVHAESGKMYKVDSETIALMDEPAKDATVVAELQKDYKVTIFEDYYGWGKTYYNNEEVWVALYQLTAVNSVNHKQETMSEAEQSDTAEKNGQLYRVQVPTINLRSAPDKNATIITQLNKNEKVTIFEEFYGWGKTYYNHEEVWIAIYLLEEDNPSTDYIISNENETAESQQTLEETETETVELQQTSEETESEAAETTSNQEEDEKENTASESMIEEEKQTVQAVQNSKKPLDGYHFVLDPGHGGKDPGAIGSEVDEKTLTLATAKKLEEKLRNQGASVTLTRADDTYMMLEERAAISNSSNTTAFISLHYNSSEEQAAHGIETFYYQGIENQRLADSVQASIINHVNLNNRGAKQANFQVLRDNNQPAILIELGFISNPEEQKLVQTDHYQEEATKGIVAGLEAYFNE